MRYVFQTATVHARRPRQQVGGCSAAHEPRAAGSVRARTARRSAYQQAHEHSRLTRRDKMAREPSARAHPHTHMYTDQRSRLRCSTAGQRTDDLRLGGLRTARAMRQSARSYDNEDSGTREAMGIEVVALSESANLSSSGGVASLRGSTRE